MEKEPVFNTIVRLSAIPASLYERTIEGVRHEEERIARRNSILSLAMACVSFALCVETRLHSPPATHFTLPTTHLALVTISPIDVAV